MLNQRKSRYRENIGIGPEGLRKIKELQEKCEKCGRLDAILGVKNRL